MLPLCVRVFKWQCLMWRVTLCLWYLAWCDIWNRTVGHTQEHNDRWRLCGLWVKPPSLYLDRCNYRGLILNLNFRNRLLKTWLAVSSQIYFFGWESQIFLSNLSSVWHLLSPQPRFRGMKKFIKKGETSGRAIEEEILLPGQTGNGCCLYRAESWTTRTITLWRA